MRRLLFWLTVIGLIWYVFTKPEYKPVLNEIKSDIQTFIEDTDFSAVAESLNIGINQLAIQLEQLIDDIPEKQGQLSSEKSEKPDLKAPIKQTFSVYNIEIGDPRSKVEQQLGPPQRTSMNEYGIEWHAYHKNYQNFMMIAYNRNDNVTGLYTNQDLIASAKGLKLGSPRQTVLDQLGEPLSKIRKGLVYYQFEKQRDYDLFQQNDSYITVFYDKHQKNTVTSIQIVSEDLEQQKREFYTPANNAIKQGFEYQLFDLTNASRVQHGLPILIWNEHVKETAWNHSSDMANNNFFSHTNLEGQSPFDRMKADDIIFSVAGENLAYGQFSSIFAHEGLMNSLGHRENILNMDFEFLGVGVAFNSESHPYYTENFFSN
ncbi:CAP domain-containing protein [Peribacillus saganii]|uniref:CAP domain-containing protein n=1 Tax=Peribacillus saganii TaxID=2303992 RepID=UPI0018F20A87|nr:CAP domain-containing protein [Peribacillus saganii]